MEQKTFYRGASLDGNRFAILAKFDRFLGSEDYFYPKTQIIEFDSRSDTWQEVATRDWFGSGIARYPNPLSGRIASVALSMRGDVLFHDKSISEEKIADGTVITLDSVAFAAGSLYALGGAGCYFQRIGSGTWVPMSEAVYDPDYLKLGPVARVMKLRGFKTVEEYDAMSPEEDMATTIELVRFETPYFAINGFSGSDLYLAGMNGALMHYDGTDFHDLDSGEEITFVEVLVHDGAIWIGGSLPSRGSVILRGDHKAGFTPVFRAPAKEHSIYRMTFFDDELYVSDTEDATGGLYRLTGSRLQRVAEISAPVTHVEATDGVLWAMEEKALNRFDGESWQRFDSPWA